MASPSTRLPLTCLIAALVLLVITDVALAQQISHISNRLTGQQLTLNGSTPVVGSSPRNAWIIEPASGAYVRIKNQATGAYLHTEDGLSAGPAEAGWWSAMWVMEQAGMPGFEGAVRIKNRWQDAYLQLHPNDLSLMSGAMLSPIHSLWDVRAVAVRSYENLPVQSYEKAPRVRALVETLKGISADASTVIDTEVVGFEETFFTGNDIRLDDHPSGITMTPQGRIVTTMSRTGADSNCGVLLYSDPYVSGRPITWHSECVIAKHPSAVQAVGEIVAVADDQQIKFFLLPTDREPFRELTHLNVRAGSTVEAVGVTYNHGNDQFYLVYSDGGVTPTGARATQTVRLCNTSPGKSLLDPATRFGTCRSIPNIKMSSQGAHLIADDNNVLYVVSTFSSTEDPDQLRDGSKCADDFLGFSDSDFIDILTVTKLESTSSGLRGVEMYSAPIGTTQSQCIANRPSWRYGGAVAATADNTLTALWAGRLFTDVAVGYVDLHAGFTDDFEIAMQTQTAGEARRAAVNESCDSNSDCANGACGRTHANDAPLVCCASGDIVNHAGYDYCTGLPRGTSCWLDSMCSSDSCSGNGYGIRRGTCD